MAEEDTERQPDVGYSSGENSVSDSSYAPWSALTVFFKKLYVYDCFFWVKFFEVEVQVLW